MVVSEAGEILIVLYDGVCALCDAWVKFILRHDSEKLFRFAPLQSMRGRELLSRHSLAADGIRSIVVIDDCHRAFRASDAALLVLRRLPAPWSWLGRLGLCFPRAFRDRVYRVIARNRYSWFGKRELCLLPAGTDRSRFLE